MSPKSKSKAEPVVRREIVRLQDSRIEVSRQGRGKPLLLLHSEDFHEGPLAAALANTHEVIMPRMPG